MKVWYHWIIFYTITESYGIWFEKVYRIVESFNFLRLTPRKNWLGQKIKILKTYVFWYNNFAHLFTILWWLYEKPRRSSRKCAKYAYFEHSADPCDLDLGPTTKNILSGCFFNQYWYILKVWWKSNCNKRLKWEFIVI